MFIIDFLMDIVFSFITYLVGLYDVVLVGLGRALSGVGLWCFFDFIGVRWIFAFVSTGVIAFSVPNLFENGKCIKDRTPYVKAMFVRSRKRMKKFSILLAGVTVLMVALYMSLWSVVPQKLCTKQDVFVDVPGVEYVYVLIALVFLALLAAYHAFKYKSYYNHHKE